MNKVIDRDPKAAGDAPDSAASGGFPVKRMVPLAVIAVAMALFFVFDLHTYISFDALKTHRMAVLDYYAQHQALTILMFGAAYTVIVALSIPGAIWMTLLAGFVFGTALGAAVVIVAATLGSLIVFLAARYAIGDLLYKKAGPFVRRMEEGFRKNAFSYLMFLRLVPLFPFWLVNLVPAFLNVGATAFVVATILGIAPATVVFASVGNGLGAVLDQGGMPDLSIVFEPHIMGPLLGLAVLALIPVVLRKFKERRENMNGSSDG
ncbi:MAG: TVP38/TMEM64 family protein [Rhodospirillales bacterium]